MHIRLATRVSYSAFFVKSGSCKGAATDFGGLSADRKIHNCLATDGTSALPPSYVPVVAKQHGVSNSTIMAIDE